jgi:hypothetical protein
LTKDQIGDAACATVAPDKNGTEVTPEFLNDHETLFRFFTTTVNHHPNVTDESSRQATFIGSLSRH